MWPVHEDGSAMARMSGGASNRMGSAFEAVFGNMPSADGGWGGMPMAMWHDDETLGVELELPGVSGADLDISVHQGVLLIRGERKVEDGRNTLYNGRWHGRFERAIRLPEGISTTDVDAVLEDGVLRITLAKQPEAKPKRIALRAS